MIGNRLAEFDNGRLRIRRCHRRSRRNSWRLRLLFPEKVHHLGSILLSCFSCKKQLLVLLVGRWLFVESERPFCEILHHARSFIPQIISNDNRRAPVGSKKRRAREVGTKVPIYSTYVVLVLLDMYDWYPGLEHDSGDCLWLTYVFSCVFAGQCESATYVENNLSNLTSFEWQIRKAIWQDTWKFLVSFRIHSATKEKGIVQLLCINPAFRKELEWWRLYLFSSSALAWSVHLFPLL